MSAEKTWGHFYENAGDVDYFMDHLAIHKDFFKEILRRAPKTTLEAGCGSGIMSIFLAMTGIRATACDRDKKVLELAAATAKKWCSPVRFLEQDIFRLSFKADEFDLVFSQGVMEHFDDEQIVRSTQEILRVSKTFIFSVPGAYYKHKDFGDERLLTENQWKKILKPFHSVSVKPYYEIRTKKNFLQKKPLMLMVIVQR